MPKIVLGVSGGISAYKAVSLTRLLIESGYEVTVVPTPSALNFVGKATWEAITGKPVYSQIFEATDRVAHVSIARSADLIVIAPATADLLYRAAAGAANDMLSSVLLTYAKRMIFFPAMHSEMWLNPATQANVETLRDRGHIVINPATGALARGDEGVGRLPEPEQITRLINSYLAKPDLKKDFLGVTSLITLGGTSESIDPVRVITNRSTGEMGAALCRALYLRGAKISAIAANHSAVLPHDIDIEYVTSVDELSSSVSLKFPDADLTIMAAAVSDFKPESRKSKVSRSNNLTMELSATEDILAKLGQIKNEKQFIVGFAAQTDEVISTGQDKLLRKKCDLLVANAVGEATGFGDRKTQIHLITKNQTKSSDLVTKDEAAHQILDEILQNWDFEH